MENTKTNDPAAYSSAAQFNRAYEATKASNTGSMPKVNAPATPAVSNSSDTSTQTPSATIGPKIYIRGELVGEEDIVIQGYVEGTIDLKSNNLTVGKSGRIRADAAAKNIVIEGVVEGDLYGEERVIIRKTSNVRGNISASRVSLEDGARFNGSIDMDPEAKRPDFQKIVPEKKEGRDVLVGSYFGGGKELKSSDKRNNKKPKSKHPEES